MNNADYPRYACGCRRSRFNRTAHGCRRHSPNVEPTDPDILLYRLERTAGAWRRHKLVEACKPLLSGPVTQQMQLDAFSIA